MSLKQRIDEDMKKAMKARDDVALGVVRMLKSAIKYREIEVNAELDDAAVLKVVQTLIKQRRDSADQFKAGGRAELADKEEKEIAVLQAYLPAQLSAEELSKLVDEALAEAKATSMKDMGAAMKLATAKVAGRADGKAVSELVRQKLAAR